MREPAAITSNDRRQRYRHRHGDWVRDAGKVADYMIRRHGVDAGGAGLAPDALTRLHAHVHQHGRTS